LSEGTQGLTEVLADFLGAGTERSSVEPPATLQLSDQVLCNF